MTLDYRSAVTDIHEFLNHDYTPWSAIGEQAFLVHGDIIEQFSEKMNANNILVNENNKWSFDLAIGSGDDIFSQKMFLVWLKHETKEQVDFLFDFFASSIYSFPWEREQNKLYLPTQQFDLIDKFVRKENWENCIVQTRIDDSRKFSLNDLTIIEFNNELDNRVTKEFGKFVTHDHEIMNSYFMVQAFQFLKPASLEHLRNPLWKFQENMLQINLLLEYHRNQAKKNKEIFDLFDVINMKMAIDDVGCQYDNCEFHKLINKMLETMSTNKTYIKNREFNLAEYQSDRAVSSKLVPTYQYLMYHFHVYFDRVIVLSEKDIIKVNLSRTNEIHDVCKNVNNETKLYIGGLDFDKNSPKMLQEMLSNRKNLSVSINLHFDTNFRWIYENIEIPNKINDEHSVINIEFSGSNQYNFIENFLNWLQLTQIAKSVTFDFTFRHFKNLKPYVMNSFDIQTLIFEMIELDSVFIRGLKRWKYDRVYFSDCELKRNDPNAFEMLHELDHVECIFVKNEAETCFNIMQQIETMLRTKPQVQFKNHFHLTPYSLNFKDLVFYINREQVQLEVYHTIFKRIINFYDYLYDDDEFYNERKDFEFYE